MAGTALAGFWRTHRAENRSEPGAGMVDNEVYG
jgi:hypothetical protein